LLRLATKEGFFYAPNTNSARSHAGSLFVSEVGS